MLAALSPSRSAAAIQRFTAEVVTLDSLTGLRSEWDSLAVSAIVPNPFYEAWLLLPAARLLAGNSDLRFVCVFGHGDDQAETRRLLGFFPLEVRRRCLNLPIRSLTLWQHRYCFLTLPLIDRDHAWSVLDAFWRWLETSPFGCSVFDTNHLLAEGPFHEVWSDFALGRCSVVLADYPRALLRSECAADEYIASAVSKKHRDEYRRLERKLQTMGTLEYEEVTGNAAAEQWTEEFLELESRGWKGGADGGAFAARPQDAEYLREVTRYGAANNRVMLLSIRLDGKPIAMKYNLLSRPGSFAFKITFDEDYAKYSPGVQLELENIRHTFGCPDREWMDSCATPRHPMANRLWKGRRMIRRTLFSVGSRKGDFVVSTLPLLRWAHHQIWPQRTGKYFQISTRQTQPGVSHP